MSILIFQHHPSEHAGTLGAALRDHGHHLKVIHLHDGQPVPSDLDDVTGLVIMGGPQNVDQTDEYPWLEGEMELIKKAHEAKLPMVGICLGAQLIVKALGGEVAAMDKPEVGFGDVRFSMPKFVDPVMQGIRWQFPAFHIHAQEITKLPPGGMPIAMSDQCKIQAFRIGLKVYGFQYHFELDQDLVRLFATFPMVAKAGLDEKTILDQMATYYPEYNRLSSRLVENIAIMLLPVDRRAAAGT